MQLEAKGKGILKTAGILMIVFGGLFALAFIAYIAIIGFIAAISGVNDGRAAGFGYFAVLFVFFLLFAAFCIVTGAIGVHNSKRPEHCTSCLVMGIVVLTFIVGTLVIYLVEDMVGFSLWIFALVGLIGIVIPTLYIIGAAMNLSSAKRGKML